ncbi:MAG: FAD-dependent oxidoreductase [Chloroflexi bacterium]|nr:FAD-dependent oxidoreductase [Chloroflexota bacterium]
MKIETVDADVLCIGGGIAGLMAAIRASELGARVVVVEKGSIGYSGAARMGNDHFWAYVPEAHGPDMRAFIKECMLTQLGPMCSTLSSRVVDTWMERSLEIVKLWEEWGIEMKYQGQWEFAGHSFPGHAMTHLKYSGHNQNIVLLDEARKRGAVAMDRVMAFELLGGAGRVTGALGIDTREDRLVEFQARSVILCTGSTRRLFLGVTPALIGNDTRPFTLTGDGRAMAYRLGAELVGMEMLARHVGNRYFVRSGQGTWIGVFRDPYGRPLGPYVAEPSRRYGDITPEVDKSLFARVMESGGGPVYMDCSGISDEDYEYMRHWLVQEGSAPLLNHLSEEGIDPRKHPIEFMSYNFASIGYIRCNEKGETSVRGLYSAGDESTFGISGAAIFGWVAAENAAAYVGESAAPAFDGENARTEEKKRLIETLQNRMDGTDWKDANIALQQVMSDYAGPVRSAPMLEAGLSHVRRLREKARNTLRAENRWELTRCVEVLNLYDLAELVFVAALERRESRGFHQRADYRMTDPLLNDQVLIVRNVDGKPTATWREKER